MKICIKCGEGFEGSGQHCRYCLQKNYDTNGEYFKGKSKGLK